MSGKVGDKVSGTAVTRHEPVTDDLWQAHVSGKSGIGIVPIHADGTVRFGAIDIDIYRDMDYKALIHQIYEEALPLVPCRSKSGGLHLFSFVREPVPAALMIKKLSAIAQHLGHGGAEIFPKQQQVLYEKGDMGSWINMPYFDAENTLRYAYTASGDPMPIDDFLTLAEGRRWGRAELESFTVVFVSDFADGPPCLETLAKDLFGEGNRNDAVYQMGVYLRKKYPQEYIDMIGDHNQSYCSPAIDEKELNMLKRSLSKKDYQYKCRGGVFQAACDKARCKRRRFGVGDHESPELANLAKYTSKPPIWFLDVVGHGRIELCTEDLQRQDKFQKRCMDDLNIMPRVDKKEDWQSMIQSLMNNVTEIDAPKEASAAGTFEHLLHKFLDSRKAQSIDELHIRKVFRDENGVIWFRFVDLRDYLDRQRFREYNFAQLSNELRKLGAEPTKLAIGGIPDTRVWFIPGRPQPIIGDVDVGGGDF